MPRSTDPSRRRANAGDSPARRDPGDHRRLLDRILDTPHVAHVVSRLQPELLHRIIQSCGVEDCAELVALTTPGQLARIFDLDLWYAGQPGQDERFDADRFAVWLEVLVECGPTVAAQKLAEIDVDLVITGLSQHARVFDRATVTPFTTTDGEESTGIPSIDDAYSVGGYVLVPKRMNSWEAIVTVLISLNADHHNYFNRVMRGCRALSNSRPEVDGLNDLLTDDHQVMFNLGVDREQRRERRGYVTPAAARAFLQMSRGLQLGNDTMPQTNPVARAYFRTIDESIAADDDAASGSATRQEATVSPEQSEQALAAVVEILLEAEILTQTPRALLRGSQCNDERLGLMQAHMQFVLDRDTSAHSKRSQELVYLGNVVMSGCSVQARPFTSHEASDAAVAVCNLGLENWPSRWLHPKSCSAFQTGSSLPADFLSRHDLVSVFQVGSTVLHEKVCLYAAEQLIGVLARLRCNDHEIQSGLDALRTKMSKHWGSGTPWRAREALDVIAILDMTAWAALLGLIDECPVIHAGMGASRGSRVRAVSATAFEFISENRQIASVRDFMQSLPEILLP